MKKRGKQNTARTNRRSRRRRSNDGATVESLRDGVLPESLETIVEFAESVRKCSVDDDDRWLHGSHPLALLVQNALEAISTTELRVTIAGLNHPAKERIDKSRRKLEKAGKREALQVLLFYFEQICDLVQDVGYRSEGAEESRQFFTETFPDWIENLGLWADEIDDGTLSERCGDAWRAYMQVSEQIVIEDDD